MPDIDTEKGFMPPERCLVYDDHRLILGDVARARPGERITTAELAGYGKTASRLYTILKPWRWATITPIHWQAPERLLFHLGDHTALLLDLILLQGRLEQLETMALQPTSTLPAHQEHAATTARSILFSRC